MFLKNVHYLLSAPDKRFWPTELRKEICLVGRSNVGKSTLINKLTNNKNMAKVSSTPGYTKYLNFFDVDQTYYLVDTPGYGYSRASRATDQSFAKMMHEYIAQRENLICIILIIDAKVGLTKDDLLLIDMVKDANRPLQLVASKADKLNQSMKYKLLKDVHEKTDPTIAEGILLYSSLQNHTVDAIVKKILQLYQG